MPHAHRQPRYVCRLCPVSPDDTQPPLQSRTVATQINQWLPLENTILTRLLAREYTTDIGTACVCKRSSAVRLFCCLERAVALSLCEECIEESHFHLHFHWIQRWNGQFFEPTDLAYLKHVIYLGHNDLPCPALSKDTPPTNMVVVHTNGVHCCLIHKCHCSQDGDETYAQLISSGLWPASITRPKTAFTEALMREWHLVWDILHQSAQDFFRVKARIGNNTRPDQVDDRYRELLVAGRLWRHYAMVKRSGRHHDIVVPHHDASSIAMPCLTCPWPGFNLPPGWDTDTPPHLKYIYRIIFGCDGNFSLQKKTKRDDPTDRSLAMGESFFIHPEKMLPLLEKKWANEIIVATCNGFKVGQHQCLSKFRFLDYSGVIATTCKHICFRPQAIVNTNRGEAYV
ncbi:hypothetical protein LXA43DRAFT_905174 [Ganoderma leucocontextum]|nr:hypothetical protein LXA43DRAFT_905174 [Ganoderma leucocontextum]